MFFFNSSLNFWEGKTKMAHLKWETHRKKSLWRNVFRQISQNIPRNSSQLKSIFMVMPLTLNVQTFSDARFPRLRHLGRQRKPRQLPGDSKMRRCQWVPRPIPRVYRSWLKSHLLVEVASWLAPATQFTQFYDVLLKSCDLIFVLNHTWLPFYQRAGSLFP